MIYTLENIEGLTCDDLVRLLEIRINSGRLILVDPEVRRIGKSLSLLKVAEKYKLPVLTETYEGSKYLVKLAEKHNIEGVFITHSITAIEDNCATNPFKGYLVDEGVTIETIGMLKKKQILLRTGFFTNYYF